LGQILGGNIRCGGRKESQDQDEAHPGPLRSPPAKYRCGRRW
jgi:hypothetical protein